MLTFFLLYKHTDDGVFNDFAKISDHFPKNSEDSPILFQRPGDRSWTFSENFRRCPKCTEDCRRLSWKTWRCFDDTPTNLSTILETNLISVKSSISSHVRISYHFYQFVTTQHNTDFYIIIVIRPTLQSFCYTSLNIILPLDYGNLIDVDLVLCSEGFSSGTPGGFPPSAETNLCKYSNSTRMKDMHENQPWLLWLFL